MASIDLKSQAPRLFALLLALPGVCLAEKYAIKDEGTFAPAGHRVEFADRYGWRSYQVAFDFSLEQGARVLSRDSKLTVKIARRGGSSWTYTCRALGRGAMAANVNFLYGKGISVVAECPIPEKEFAKAVDLDPQDIGLPNLVFQVMIRDGEITPGSQRGLYFVPGGQIESSDISAYASNHGDPTSLAVVFRSN